MLCMKNFVKYVMKQVVACKLFECIGSFARKLDTELHSCDATVVMVMDKTMNWWCVRPKSTPED